MLLVMPPKRRSATPSTKAPLEPRARGSGALVLLASLLCASCTKHGSPAVAVVNGTRLSPDTFAAYVTDRTRVAPAALDPVSRERELHAFEALCAAALEEAATTDPKAQAIAELARFEALAHFGAERAGVYAAPTEADLKAAYQSYTVAAPTQEFHVAHILVATDSQARAVIEELQHGRNFADLAATQSADESKTRGGDLGWITPGHLPPQFMSAVESLKTGKFTSAPVKSQYGWHVIQLLDERATRPADFDSVRPQLAANLIQERYQAFLATALRTAKISRP
jgi:peptidyl-prolyl cis-trans isomerase C